MKVTYFRTAYVSETTCEERDLVQQKMNHWAEGDGGCCTTRESISEWLKEHADNCDVRTDSVSDSDEKLAKFLHELEEAFDDGDIGDVIFSS